MTTLLIASPGGHLLQLHRLLPKLGIQEDCVWITFDTPASRSLLQNEQVEFAPHANPHDAIGTIRDTAFAWRILRKYKVQQAISTGANLAVAFLPLCALLGVKSKYIESATRTSGPSTTGMLLQRFPKINLYTQHANWANNKWRLHSTVFDQFYAMPDVTIPSVRKLVVTLGTNKKYDFSRLINRLLSIIPSSVEVFWQIGNSSVQVEGAHYQVSQDELTKEMIDADAVITHGGVGSAISVMETGKFPLLVPRKKAKGEHVDNHQIEFTKWLQVKGLAMSVDADELIWQDICIAASWGIKTNA